MRWGSEITIAAPEALPSWEDWLEIRLSIALNVFGDSGKYDVLLGALLNIVWSTYDTGFERLGEQ